ncbi:putative exported protein [Yersinia pestis biovar Medievalis str. Harbin 35]|nr:putative exported protein [Yersinia pestis biovar Medievalis str. Harbin 35]EEO75916.1 putative exported protein [Yersinia pestis Nepal516]EEO82582.1 putative exported protein [Yersinia pestis biovar Orientalis str. India 195]EEO86550.1 putative exported protein [Yersinia pestis biovar Orientalis str. PEXU2]EEO92221.1 putative exported protein [Yersinia pestis Pestoides A]
MNGEDRQRSKASAPRMARLEPTWMYLRRLYDLPVLSVAGTLSITSIGLLYKPTFPVTFYPLILLILSVTACFWRCRYELARV